MPVVKLSNWHGDVVVTAPALLLVDWGLFPKWSYTRRL